MKIYGHYGATASFPECQCIYVTPRYGFIWIGTSGVIMLASYETWERAVEVCNQIQFAIAGGRKNYTCPPTRRKTNNSPTIRH